MGAQKLKYVCAKAATLSAFLVIAPSVAIAPSIDVAAETHFPEEVSSTGAAQAAAPTVIALAPSITGLNGLSDAVTRVVKVKRGDTLMKMALNAGVPRNDAHKAITALGKVFDPRKLRPGQDLSIIYLPKGEKADSIRLQALRLDANAYQGYVANRTTGAGFVADTVTKALETRLIRARGTVDANLFDAGTASGMPPAILISLIRLYSWDVDFQRDIQPGDSFDVVFERVFTEDGTHVREGNIVFSRLVVSGTTLPLYRYEYAAGETDYFDDRGESARKPLLRTPIDGARLSSRFGRRRHPILGYNRMHRGVDFAASRGTPIYAAGDGRIVRRGRHGAYGRYVRIRHNAEFATAYGHMNGYKKGLKVGSRVKQGQVIGYVGSSGRSTGPHLHYEVVRSGRQVNPLVVKLPSGRTLKGKKLEKYQQVRLETDRQIATVPVAVARN